ncbi:hypothetical protein [Enterococcus mundtii]|uniref:hypothetical protein n=1 Tax=Enterococcus mundtii TaxID=53346 RepID=UPI0035C77823
MEKRKSLFLAAPNPTQLRYWQEMATEFEAQNDEITVEVTQMKECPSSEATIQSGIASNTAPTLSCNVNRSFAAHLAASGRNLAIKSAGVVFSSIVGGKTHGSND